MNSMNTKGIATIGLVILIITGLLALAVIGTSAYIIGVNMGSTTDTTNDRITENVNNNENAEINENDVAEDIDVNVNEVIDNIDVDEESEVDDVEVAGITTTAGVTWLAEPEVFSAPNIFKEYYSNTLNYFTIANLEDGGQIIYLAESSMGTSVARFRVDTAGTYYLLTNHSDQVYQDQFAESFQDFVEQDTETIYPELDYPSELVLGDLAVKQTWLPFTYNKLFATNINGVATVAQPTEGTMTLVETTPYGDVYVHVKALDTEAAVGIESKTYYLVLPDTSTIMYIDALDFLADDGSVIGKFESSAEAFYDKTFTPGIIMTGCGTNSGDQYLGEVTLTDLVQIGETPSGVPLYTVADSNSAILQAAYDTYSVGRDYDGSQADFVSYDDFVADQPVLIWPDNAGDYRLFLDAAYGPLAECGKPVVYLYPTQVTDVTVKVGADITVSEPEYYNEQGTGWQVLAQPSGELRTSSGEVVPNLFWEGTGYGEYPHITTGTVIPRSSVEKTIRANLATLGLSAQETQDFVEFWMPRMPHTPYVRLTWFTTQQMDNLAPLYVSPRPDTVLRVFLDFEGQTTSHTTLQRQVLTNTPRTGFTVVEWGGLLVGRK